MIATLKALFAKPPIDEILFNELDEAERELLEAQTGLEYAHSIVQYNKARIARLRAAIENQNK